MDKLLSLDFSSSSTGYSIFDMNTHQLLEYGLVLPKKVKKSIRDCQLQVTVDKLRNLAQDIKLLVERVQPKQIIIEEICRSKNRLAQKTLDGAHHHMMAAIYPWLPIVTYVDSDGGPNGWRTGLGLKLSEEDKLSNKRNKLLNKSIKRGQPKQPIFTAKDLAQRLVNKLYNLNFDVQNKTGDDDQADSICMATFYLQKYYPLKK